MSSLMKNNNNLPTNIDDNFSKKTLKLLREVKRLRLPSKDILIGIMIKWTTISTDDGFCNLSALLERDVYFGVSLNFNDSDRDIWDNERYLVYELLPYLKGEVGAYDDKFNEIFGNRKEEVLEIFEEAIEMGFFTLI